MLASRLGRQLSLILTFILLLTMAVPVPAFAQDGITLDPTRGARDTEVRVSGDGFSPEAELVIWFAGNAEVAQATADATGAFATTFNVPPDASVGGHAVSVETSGMSGAAVATFTVTEEEVTPRNGEQLRQAEQDFDQARERFEQSIDRATTPVDSHERKEFRDAKGQLVETIEDIDEISDEVEELPEDTLLPELDPKEVRKQLEEIDDRREEFAESIGLITLPKLDAEELRRQQEEFDEARRQFEAALGLIVQRLVCIGQVATGHPTCALFAIFKPERVLVPQPTGELIII